MLDHVSTQVSPPSHTYAGGMTMIRMPALLPAFRLHSDTGPLTWSNNSHLFTITMASETGKLFEELDKYDWDNDKEFQVLCPGKYRFKST